MIRDVTIMDAAKIAAIYNYYVHNSIITLEEAPVSTEEMEALIRRANTQFPWIVFEEEGQLLGYAYASPWNSRSGYKQTVETTVYLANNATKNGIGSHLYDTLITRLKKLEYQVIIGGISLPNDASVLFHEKFGFKKVAHFNAVGYKHRTWVDVGYWELQLNNHSKLK